MNKHKVFEIARAVIDTEAETIQTLKQRIDDNCAQAGEYMF